jgi:hypothetical protein
MPHLVAPISVGELFDKLSILEIKLERIKSTAALENVNREYRQLQNILNQHDLNTSAAMHIFAELKDVNQKLWDIEDQIREKERTKSFDDEFIRLARSVYVTNDERSKTKRKINKLFNSDIVEEKFYAEY